MPTYKHTQTGALLLWILGGGAAATGIGALVATGYSGAVVTILTIVCAIMGICAYIFNSLRVEVRTSDVAISFGPGWIRKRFPLVEITSAKKVTNRWFYGWGIRYTPHGWLYNVSGWDAVEIHLRNGKKYRIGTDEPEELCSAIRSAITRGINTSTARSA